VINPGHWEFIQTIYAEYVLVPSYKYLVKLDEDMDLDASATLSCSGLTAYSAIKSSIIKANENVVIVGGTGGLGLMAVQLAKGLTGAKVIVIGLHDNKLQAAKKCGADAIVNSNKEDPIKAIMEMTDKLGADAIIDIVNASKTLEIDMQILRRRGRLVLAAKTLPSTTIKLCPFSVHLISSFVIVQMYFVMHIKETMLSFDSYNNAIYHHSDRDTTS
jgi:D-arabinose 1-dehydrogenase-like Zn-dependent alcohol dehydrogenase